MKKTGAWIIAAIILSFANASAEDGYRLWLRYDLIADRDLRDTYRDWIRSWIVSSRSPSADTE